MEKETSVELHVHSRPLWAMAQTSWEEVLLWLIELTLGRGQEVLISGHPSQAWLCLSTCASDQHPEHQLCARY